MNDEKYCVELFDGTNFSLWARRVEAVLAAKNLDVYLSREADRNKPDEVLSSKKAYALMLSFLSDKILLSLSDEITCAEIFAKLKVTYLREGAVSQILIRKRLALLRKRKEVTMQEHIDELNGLVNQLKLCNVKISDMDVIVYLLMSLPSEYDSYKAAIENQPNENLNLELVCGRLLDAEALLKDKRHVESRISQNDMFTNAAFSTNRRNIICYKCKSKGHIAKFCKNNKAACARCGKYGHSKDFCRLKFNKKNRKEEEAGATFVIDSMEEKLFIVDSGATSHMCSQSDWFEDLKPSTGTVACASKTSQLTVTGIGTIRAKMRSGREIVLTNVLHIPELNANLISVKKIVESGYMLVFKNDIVVVRKENVNFVLGKLNHKEQYISNLMPIVSDTMLAVKEEAELWHRRLGHSGKQAMKKLGLPTNESFCDKCILAKQPGTVVGKGSRKREKRPMRLIHTDICGPVEPCTVYGERYVLTLIDDYSRFCEVRLLKHKSDISVEFKKFFKMYDSISKLRCDNAREYVSGELKQIADQFGVTIEPCPPYTPHLNGVAERVNRTLFDKARALLYDSKLPKSYWGFAVQAAAYLYNRIPNASINNDTPYELKYSRKPDLNQIKVFGCDVYVKIPDVQRKKLDPKSRKMIFVGYSDMGYRVMDPITKRVSVSRNVVFNEYKVLVNDCVDVPQTVFEKDNSPIVENEKVGNNEDSEEENGKVGSNEDSGEAESDEQENLDFNENKEDFENDDCNDSDEDPPFRRPQRERKLPSRFNEYVMIATHDALTFEDIQKLPESEKFKWKEAMDDEINSMKENKVWELVNNPEDGKRPISCKWVFRKKRDGKYRARLVARGFLQKYGLDYTETYSPVISISSLRLVLAIILQEELHACVMDVKTAFLNGDLEETVYMLQPDGYDDGTGRVCKLLKSLYGLKQAPRQWFHKFAEFMSQLKFEKTEADPCIFIRNWNGKRCFICLYVDDLLLAGSDKTELQTIINLLQSRFKMSKTEMLTEFIGIRIQYTSDKLLMDQEDYISKALKKFNMNDCRPSRTPLEPKSTSASFLNSPSFEGPYRELIGTLFYLAITTRPDILFPVNCLSQLQEKPTVAAWQGLKRILRYLKGTMDWKIAFRKQTNPSRDLKLYVDADWASNSTDRKSVSGYVMIYNNCPILWCSKKQNCVTLSSTEAEFLAISKSLQDLLYYRSVIEEIACVENTTIFEDNQSAIKCVTSEKYSGRLKHLDVKLKYVREMLKKHKILIKYVSTDKQIADLFTKCLPKPRLMELLKFVFEVKM